VGFYRLTPQNARATWVAGVTTFVIGGGLVCLVGAGSLLLAAVGAMQFSWEQVALTMIGTALVAVGMLIPRRSQKVE